MPKRKSKREVLKDISEIIDNLQKAIEYLEKAKKDFIEGKEDSFKKNLNEAFGYTNEALYLFEAGEAFDYID